MQGAEKELEGAMDGHGQAHGYGYTPRKEDYLKRLRRIEGQVRGLQRMVEEDN
jgi:hypothetical protein